MKTIINSLLKPIHSLLLSLIIGTLLSCSRQSETPAPTPVADEVLLDETITLLDQAPRSTLRTQDVTLPSGDNLRTFLLANDPNFLNAHPSALPEAPLPTSQKGSSPTDLHRTLGNSGPQMKKALLISYMTQTALSLVKSTSYPAGADPSTEPAQPKLGYVYGSRQITSRAVSSGQCKTQKLYGLDCSGFIYTLAKAAGLDLKLPTYAALQSQPATWTAALTAIPELAKVKVEEQGILADNEFDTGDIVYFKNPSGEIKHIGIVLKSGADLYFFHSYGKADKECEKNNDGKRGPVQMKVSSIKTFFPASQLTYAGTLRIITDISGSWKYYDQCVGGNQPAVVDLTFNPKSDGTFTAQGAGSGFTVALNCTYAKKTNILDILLTTSFPSSPSRQDKVSMKLSQDDTGFIKANWISGTRGCDIEVKLVNQEK